MKKNIIFAIALLALASCNKNENDPILERVPVAFSASIGLQLESRASNKDWEANDSIGIFMIAADSILKPTTIKENAENIGYSTTDEHGIFGPIVSPIYFPMDNSFVNFIAYYPQRPSLNNYTYNIDVASQSNQGNIDFMYSKEANKYNKNTNNVRLVFSHQLCKVVLNVTKGVGVKFEDMNSLTVKVNQQNTLAHFDLTFGDLTPLDSKNDITMLKGSTNNSEETITYEAILLPAVESYRIFEFNLNNSHDAAFKWNMGKELQGGNKYTYNVKLNRTGLNVEGSITNWTENQGGNTEAD